LFQNRITRYPCSTILAVRTASYVGGIDMLASIQFNDQPLGSADKIAYISSDRHLAAEFQACQLRAFQIFPQQAFRIGGVVSKLAGKVSGTFKSIG